MKHERRFETTPVPNADDSSTAASPNAATRADTSAAPEAGFNTFAAYQRDFAERTILFLDALRQRADDMLAHERAGKPPLLDFTYELLLDARRFEPSANYALLRVTRVGDVCLEDCLDPAKPPVIIIDPRAGHGPGIGGFKQESEVGIALHEGYPVYFVIFFPEPSPGQTLADVHHALRRFLEEVARRHPGSAPVLYGNCQAGWAVTLLAADCAGVAGPLVLNGSPLSYWAGESGVNPMRISGGLLGGVWPAHLLADLGGGRFDGAWLVQNFENLKPESVWDKYANLFAHIDDERERFLAFERWWGGFYFLGREEILAIIQNLFIGNQLEQGTLRMCEGCVADLRRIRSPMVIFASYGDNITPPHQALGWIPAVYKDTADLEQAGQRVVYLVNPHVGHLGLFVSAAVAKLEHRAILEGLPRIGALAPGLYEMKIDNPTGDPDCAHDAYTVRFEKRRVEDIRFAVDGPAFERVRTVSDQLDALYTQWVSPWMRMAANPFVATLLPWLHPMRTSRYLFGTAFNPFMQGVAAFAQAIRADRHPVPDTAPLKQSETQAAQAVHDALRQARETRDAAFERLFAGLYGSGAVSVAQRVNAGSHDTQRGTAP